MPKVRDLRAAQNLNTASLGNKSRVNDLHNWSQVLIVLEHCCCLLFDRQESSHSRQSCNFLSFP